MAGNDVVGALYYKVVLDPRGYAKGVTKVKSEQDLLVRALKSSYTELDRLQAELDAIGARYLKAKEEERKILRDYQREIIEQMEAIFDAEEKAAKQAEEKTAEKAAKEEADAIQLVLDKHKEKQKLIDELAKLQEKAEKEASANILKAEKDRIAEEKRLEKELAEYRKQRMGRRYEDLSRYFTSFGRFRVGLRRLGSELGNVNGGLSKMAGNLAQAMGLSPAVQGMARAFGSMGLKILAVGAAFTALFNFLKASIAKFEEFRKNVVRLEPLLGGSTEAAKALLHQMMDLAIQTGYSSDSMFVLAEALLNVGTSVQSVEGIAKTISGLAGGDEQRLKSIAKAYADVMMKGRLMGQEALQFANAGIPIYQALANHLKKDVSEIREMGEQGLISAQMMSDALLEFGKTRDISGQIEKNMRSVAGQMQRILGILEKIQVEAGETADGPFVAMLTKLGDIIEAFVDLRKESALTGKGFLNIFVTPLDYVWKSYNEMANLIADIMTGGGLTKQKRDQWLKDLEEETDRAVEEAMAKHEAFVGTQMQNAKKMMDDLRQREATERQLYKAKLDEMVIAKEITQQQSDQLQMEYDRLEVLKHQREEKQRMIDEERQEAERKVNEEAERQRRAFAGATAKAGPSFEAGGRGEFNFLRDLLLGRRQNTEELRIMKEQEKTLKEIKANSDAQLAELAEMSPDFVGPVMPVGGP
jgi:tape measure domain-containing protein